MEWGDIQPEKPPARNKRLRPGDYQRGSKGEERKFKTKREKTIERNQKRLRPNVYLTYTRDAGTKGKPEWKSIRRKKRDVAGGKRKSTSQGKAGSSLNQPVETCDRKELLRLPSRKFGNQR